jgi:hypothetical protein
MGRAGSLAGARDAVESMRSVYASLHAEIDHLL